MSDLDNIKPWSEAEEKRSREIDKYLYSKYFATDEFEEIYKENHKAEVYKEILSGEGVIPDEEIVVDAMNLVYASNWDENDCRVKKDKAVPGSVHYIVSANGDVIRETGGYKTKNDAIHAAKLYMQDRKKFIEYLKSKKF